MEKEKPPLFPPQEQFNKAVMEELNKALSEGFINMDGVQGIMFAMNNTEIDLSEGPEETAKKFVQAGIENFKTKEV